MPDRKFIGVFIYGGALAIGFACTQMADPSTNGLGLSDDNLMDTPVAQCSESGEPGDDIDVGFECSVLRSVESVAVASCKDLSNVVLGYADGSHQKFEGLSSSNGTFTGTGKYQGKAIETVWVKAGANHSGDGPGYGERFDVQDCSGGDPQPNDNTPPADDAGTEEPPPADDAGTEEPPPADDAGTEAPVIVR